MALELKTPTAAAMRAGTTPVTVGTVNRLLTEVTQDGRLTRTEAGDIFLASIGLSEHPASTRLGGALLRGTGQTLTAFVDHRRAEREPENAAELLRFAASSLFNALRRRKPGEPVSGAELQQLKERSMNHAIFELGGTLTGSSPLFDRMAEKYPAAFTFSGGSTPTAQPLPSVRAAYERNLAQLRAGKVDENQPFESTWKYLRDNYPSP